MKKTIEFDFEAQRKKQEDALPLENCDQKNPGEIIEVDFLAQHQERNGNKWFEASERAASLSLFLSRLKRRRSSSDTEASLALVVNGYSDNEVMEMIIGSSENAWINKPTFYALLLERFRSLGMPDEAENG